tara:strand:+ start:3621 stop:3851 length:231 start_codon:yes stop_codon:yes gene_type:complete
MIKNTFYELLRWSLRLHGIFHVGHVYSDVLVGNWVGVAIGSYIILVELLSSFLIPNEHVHFRLMKSEVHEKCEDKD